MRGRWELVGRSDARDAVETVLRGEGPASLVVHGPAGIGKSRLVDDAVARSCPDAWRIRASAPLRTMPLGAVALAVPGAVTGAVDRRALVQAAIAAIEAAGPPAIWVDDAHQLDPESAAVVLQLVQRRATPVVLTVRDGEPQSPAVAALTSTAADLALEPLDAASVGELAVAMLGAPLAEPSLRRLHRRCSGNPLLLRELVRSGLASGDLTDRGGFWHLATRPSTPAGLEDLVADHALGMSRPAVELFQHIAVADHLAEAAAEKLASQEAISELIDAGLVRRHQDPDVLRPDHPLYAEVVLARLSDDERRSIAGRLAEAVEALDLNSDGAGDDEVRAVRWRLEAGAPVACDRATAVAWLALAVFDLELTEAAARAAVDGGNEAAALPLANALAYRGQNEAAVPYFERAFAAAVTEWDRAFAHLTGTLNRAYWEGWDRWVAEAHRETAESVTDPLILRLLHSEEVSALAFSGYLEEAVAIAGPIVGDPGRDPAEALPYVPGWAASRSSQGATGEVIEALARIEATLTEAPNRGHAWLFAFRAQAEVLHGRLTDAERAMAVFDQLAAYAMVEDVAAVLSAEMRGIVALERGDIDVALRWLEEAVALSEVPEARFRRVVPWAFLTQARALAGDEVGASDAAAEARCAAALFPLSAGYADRAAGWARAAAGDLTGAARLAAAGAEDNARRGMRTIALWCAHDALRFAPSPTAAARVRDLALGMDGAWAEAFRSHACALGDPDPRALLRPADEFVAMGATVQAAEVLELAAVRLRSEGHRDGARRAAARARELRASCGVPRSGGAMASDDPAVASLTNREREAATLAAAGCSNAEMAERLGLSVRTAEGHLARAMTKLGVSRRTELAERLHGHEARVMNA
jgi:DNA-binding CsgD family transcriptional regulator